MNDMTTKLKAEVQTTVRRVAAKILGDYAPPPLACSEELFQALEAAAGRTTVDGEWATFAAEIGSALKVNGVDQFLRLPPIAKTVHPRIRSHGRRYLTYLLRSKRFSSRIQKALTESPVGKPLVNPHYPFSSPLLVQHGYHLIRLLESTDFDLSQLRLVVDFGGGYGSFFRLLRNLDYRERYVICDLPVMCALQRFYLRNVFPTGPGTQAPENLRWQTDNVPETLKRETAEHSPSLFVATWSLSETPLAVRDAIAPALAGFNYVLFAYQRAFGVHDNIQYFTALEKTLPQFNWQHAECPVYKNNFYLIGQRVRTA
jgi:hypothetical protein